MNTEDTYAVISCDLIEEALQGGEDISFNISTKSMLPLFAPGDRAMIKRISSRELKFGDPVLFKKGDGSIYLHRYLFRVDKNGQYFLVTKGDNEFSFDGYVSEDGVMGVAVGRRKNGSLLKFDAPFWKLVNRGTACLSLSEGIIFSILRWIKKSCVEGVNII